MDEESLNQDMDKVLDNLKQKFSEVRAGRTNPTILNRINVEYYGQPTPLNQVASISFY